MSAPSITARVGGRVPLWLPYALGAALLVIVPAAMTVVLAFTEFSGLGAPRFTGLENVRRMTGDAALRDAVTASLIVIVVAVPLRLALALGFALLLHGRGVAAATGRSAIYVPSVVPETAMALLWLWFLNPLYGPVAAIARSAGLQPPALLVSGGSARIVLAIVIAFQVGETFLVILAARRLIPLSVYEAAAVDGADRGFVMRRITLPLLAPLLVLLALRDGLAILQGSFVLPFLLTGGGPDGATTLLPLYTYQVAFRYFRLGYGAAISLVTLAVTGVVLLLQVRIVRRYAATFSPP